LFDEIKSIQPLPRSNPGDRATEFRETQQLLTFRFLYRGPPGTDPALVWRKPVVGAERASGPESGIALPKRPVGPER
jgi:hypothetical protein